MGLRKYKINIKYSKFKFTIGLKRIMKPYHIVLILILAVRRVEILVPMYKRI